MIDANSDTWISIQAFINKRLGEHREELEDVHCDERAANVIRGRIDECKTLLEIASPDSGEVSKPLSYL